MSKIVNNEWIEADLDLVIQLRDEMGVNMVTHKMVEGDNFLVHVLYINNKPIMLTAFSISNKSILSINVGNRDNITREYIPYVESYFDMIYQKFNNVNMNAYTFRLLTSGLNKGEADIFLKYPAFEYRLIKYVIHMIKGF